MENQEQDKEHIEAFAALLDKDSVKKQFSAYLKNNVDPKQFSTYVTEISNKIKEMK